MTISQKWKDTVNKGITDKRWDEYDLLIITEVNAYNQRFAGTPKFFTLNWLYIKAVLWIESGGPDNSSWKTRPMQIGNPGDPAYQVLKSGKEGANKIMDATLFNELKAGDINKPTLNIKSGIAYLFTRMVKFEQKSIVDEKDMSVYEHKLVKGETFASLAKEKDTTIEELKNRNPMLTPTLIKPGQTLKYRKAKMDIVIAGWRTFSLSEIAQRYNVGAMIN